MVASEVVDRHMVEVANLEAKVATEVLKKADLVVEEALAEAGREISKKEVDSEAVVASVAAVASVADHLVDMVEEVKVGAVASPILKEVNIINHQILAMRNKISMEVEIPVSQKVNLSILK